MDKKTDVFDSANVLMFIIRWWKHLVIICFVAALAGVIFSSPYFITPKYQSTVVIFPATPGSLSRSVLMSGGVPARDFLSYGELEDAERLLQVLESSRIRDRVVERFDLTTHFGIAKDDPFRKTRLIQQYRSNVSFRRTQYGAVEVSVRDTHPRMAADIANELAALADTLQNELRFERANLAYQVAKDQLEIIQQQAIDAEDSLRRVMSRGIVDIEGQSTMITRQLAKDISAGYVEGVKALEDNLEVLAAGGGAFIYMSQYLRIISGQEVYMKRRYQEAKVDLENFLPFQFVLDSAFEAERKVYPIRWLIVFLSTFGAGFMGIMVMIVYENLLNKGIIKTKSKKPLK